MKIEQLFVQHLYQQKHTTLEGIGFFKLKVDARFPIENEKETTIAPDAFSFEYNLKTPEDESLVDYIVQQTGKIKPLAKSDLESYSMLAKQFLNLGKPLIIEGVGTLQINQKGEYQFLGGNFINPKIDDVFQQIKERKDDEVSFESENNTGNKKNSVFIGAAIAGILLIGLALYYFLGMANNPKPNKVNEIATITDSSMSAINHTDTEKNKILADSTTKIKLDTNKNVLPVSPSLSDTSAKETFRIILKDYHAQVKVKKAYDRLREWGHKVNIIKTDSANYKLFMSFTRPLSDTNKVRDSIKRFFGGKPYVLNN